MSTQIFHCMVRNGSVLSSFVSDMDFTADFSTYIEYSLRQLRTDVSILTILDSYDAKTTEN